MGDYQEREDIMQIIGQISNRSYELTKSSTDVKEQRKSFETKLFSSYVYFILYSFIGWVWETVITTIDTGVLQKRGFLDVPLLPIYGFAITFIVTLFYNKGYSIPKIFFGSAMITSIQEFITSWVMEKMFHQVWWDYSQMRFQIQGRVCLIGAITFGVASVLIVQLVHPKIDSLVRRFLDQEKSRKLCLISAGIIILDTIMKCVSLLR